MTVMQMGFKIKRKKHLPAFTISFQRVEFSFILHKASRYLYLNIQRHLSFFFLRNDERSLCTKVQKRKKQTKGVGRKSKISDFFCTFQLYILMCSQRPIHPPPLQPLLYLTVSPPLTPMPPPHPRVPSFLPSHIPASL